MIGRNSYHSHREKSDMADSPQHVPYGIPGWRKSQALLSLSSATTAVVFVHGFYGDRRKTWINFQAMIEARSAPAWWSTVDLYFYAYPSVRQQLGPNADKLEKFIGYIWPNPPRGLLTLDRPFVPVTTLKDRRYTDIVLIGHSEGAVVIRTMLMGRIHREQD